MRVSRLSLCSVILTSLGACSEATSPSGPGFEVRVAPLTLPGITNACYRLTVTNGPNRTGDIVWQQDNVCADQYGDTKGSITYVGTCDAGVTGENSVTLELLDLQQGTPATTVPDGEYQNPCGMIGSWSTDRNTLASGEDGHGPCTINKACAENADTPVDFDITIMRDANQGFFDVAVNFEDIFCSAKLDTCYAGNAPIDLLFKPDGTRGPTAVLALACTAGPGSDVDTVLHLGAVALDCPAPFADITLDPSVGPGNAYTFAPTTTDPNPTDAVFQYAVYEGTEDLQCGEGVSCNKIYWNVAIGLDPTKLPAGCVIRARATASNGGFADGDGNITGTPPHESNGFSSGTYPVIEVDSTITTAAGSLACVQDGLNDGGGVSTGYTALGQCAPTFCYYNDGETTAPVWDGSTPSWYTSYADSVEDPLSLGELCAAGIGQCCVENFLKYAEAVGLAGNAGSFSDFVAEFCQ